MKSLEKLIRELPPNLQGEVRDFAESLLQRRSLRKGRHLRLTWAGGLRRYSEQYTALELQRKAQEWWGD